MHVLRAIELVEFCSVNRHFQYLECETLALKLLTINFNRKRRQIIEFAIERRKLILMSEYRHAIVDRHCGRVGMTDDLHSRSNHLLRLEVGIFHLRAFLGSCSHTHLHLLADEYLD